MDKHGWKQDFADMMEKQYRQYLCLIGTYPAEEFAPWSDPLDDFWHAHILDTKVYSVDCQELFGKVIHHDPRVGSVPGKKERLLARTRELYLATFGAHKPRTGAVSTAYSRGSSPHTRSPADGPSGGGDSFPAWMVPMVFLDSGSGVAGHNQHDHSGHHNQHDHGGHHQGHNQHDSGHDSSGHDGGGGDGGGCGGGGE